MTSPAILNKIKFLLKLSSSPNQFEADSAKRLADGLIEKHNVSPQELESLKDPKPLYGEEDKLYSSLGIVSWRQQLAVCLATHLSCQIVQEEFVPPEGAHPFHYYVYGDPEDVKNVQLVFQVLANKVEILTETYCIGKEPIYISSYCEGAVDAIKSNIALHGINLPEVKKDIKKQELANININGDEIVKPAQKPKPADRNVDVNSQSTIKDITAYFTGLADGKDLFLDDILEIAAKEKETEAIPQQSTVGDNNEY